MLNLTVDGHLGEFGLGARLVGSLNGGLATEIEVLGMLCGVSHARSRLMQAGHSLVRVLKRFFNSQSLPLFIVFYSRHSRVYHVEANIFFLSETIVFLDLLRFFLEFLFRLKTIEFLHFAIGVHRFGLGDFLLNEQTMALFVQLLPGISDGLHFLNLALLLIFFFLNTEISKFIFDLIIDFHGPFATAETSRLIQTILLFPLVHPLELSRYEASLHFIDVGELGFGFLVGRVVVFLFGHVHAFPAQRSALIWANLGFVSGDSRFDLLAWSS